MIIPCTGCTSKEIISLDHHLVLPMFFIVLELSVFIMRFGYIAGK